MIKFEYEYKIVPINYKLISSHPDYVSNTLNAWGSDGWIINCSIGENLILSKAKMTHNDIEDKMSSKNIDHEMKLDYDPCG